MKMRKLVAALLAVLLLCSIIPFSVAAESHSATIDFTDKANRTAYSTEQQVWEQNGITVTNDKGASTSNVGDYGGEGYPVRFYKSSTVKVEYPGMTKIEFYCDDYKDSYATDLAASIADGSVSVDGTVVTVTLAASADSLVIAQLAAQVRVDSITVYGAGGSVTPPVEPDEPDEPDQPVDSLGVIADPVAGVAYKFGMVQENVSSSDVYYLIGGMAQTYYLATGKDAATAIDVYLEETDGGYYLYTLLDGAKTYINMVVSEDGKHVNGAYEASASIVYTYDADYQTIIADIDGAYYWFGTRNDKTYTTVGPCNIEYNGFYCQFYAAEGGDTPVEPPVEPDEPDVPDVPDVPVEPDDDIDTTIPYLLGMVQENVSTEDVYFLNGAMNGFYMETTTDAEAAILVYLEKTAGGYYLYALDEDDNKVYINMVVSEDGKHVNGAYESAPSTVYTYDYDLWTLVAEVNDDVYAFGTRNDRNYTTMGPVKVSYNGFHADLYYFEDDVEDPCEHEYDNACDDECNLCGELREVGDHEYDNAYDADCNHCGYIRDLPIYGGAIGVVQNSAHAGENVNLTVQVDGNPGIVSAKVKVYFDTTLLEFVSAVEGNFSASGYSWSDFETAQENGYIIINWCDATKPNSTANLLATLTFKVKEDAPVGFADVWVEFNCDADIFNADDKTVYFDAIYGGVDILDPVDVVPGDANGDGKVNNRDLGILQKKLNGADIVVDEVAVDMDGNGKINNRDLGLLQKLLNS